MLDAITITLDDEGDLPRFRLTEGTTSPRISSVAVVDGSSDRPIWWLVPAAFLSVLPFTGDDVTPGEMDALADAEPFDPIEDLPPSDPRHQAALAIREGGSEADSPVLGSLTYGVVPAGFRQAAPEEGITTLVSGNPYTLTVMGPGGYGSIMFRVK